MPVRGKPSFPALQSDAGPRVPRELSAFQQSLGTLVARASALGVAGILAGKRALTPDTNKELVIESRVEGR